MENEIVENAPENLDSGGDFVVEIEETPNPVAPQVETPPVEKSPEQTDGEDAGKRAERRIRGLVQERKSLEARLNALEQASQDKDKRLKELQDSGAKAQERAFSEMEERVKAQQSLAKREFAEARASGDVDKETEAMQLLSSAETQMLVMKAQKARQPTPPVETDVEVEVERAPVRQEQRPEPDARTKAWVEKNPWINSINDSSAEPEDRDMAQTAARAHIYATQVMGYHPVNDAEAYWGAVDKAVKERFPHRFKEPAPQNQTPARQNVANPRQPTNTGTRKVKVTLTPKEVEFAKRHNVDLKVLAREKARLQENR